MEEIDKINKYYKDRIGELQLLVEKDENKNPWVFQNACSFLDCLTKLVNNKEETGGDDYKIFINKYLALVDERYKSFRYIKEDKQDLPEQMYHILRCGIIHNFSLIPDTKAKGKGRNHSIALTHDENAKHLSNYSSEGFDSAIFKAQDFINDLQKVVDIIFKDEKLKNNILGWVEKYPPVGFHFYT